MATTTKELGRKLVTVTIHNNSALEGEALSELVKSKSVLRVVGVSSTRAELIEEVKGTHPDVVLLCNGSENRDLVDLIPLVFAQSSESKVLILTANDEPFDHLRALKEGATGMVSPDKSIEVLARAIVQVADGEICLNQKHVAQLINPDNEESDNGSITGVNNLTSREIEVIQSIARGMKNKEVAISLSISEATVRHHLSSVYSKLFVEDRLNLVIFAYQHDLVKPRTDNSEEFHP